MGVIGQKVKVVAEQFDLRDEHGNIHTVGGGDKDRVGLAVDWLDQRASNPPEDRRWMVVVCFDDCKAEDFAPMAERHAWGHDHVYFRPCDLVDDATGKPVEKAPW